MYNLIMKTVSELGWTISV